MIDDDNWIDARKCVPELERYVFVKKASGELGLECVFRNSKGKIIWNFQQKVTHWKPFEWVAI